MIYRYDEYNTVPQGVNARRFSMPLDCVKPAHLLSKSDLSAQSVPENLNLMHSLKSDSNAVQIKLPYVLADISIFFKKLTSYFT